MKNNLAMVTYYEN